MLVSICFNLQILRTTNTSEVARRKCGLSLHFWEVAVVLLKPDLVFKFGPANIWDTVLLQVTCKL